MKFVYPCVINKRAQSHVVSRNCILMLHKHVQLHVTTPSPKKNHRKFSRECASERILKKFVEN